jgi:hypothetical protein
MKKAVVLLTVLTLVVVAAAFAANPKPVFKIGNEVYVCNCPEANCPCQTISKKPGKCPCGTEMIKAKVTGTVKGEVTLMAAGWEKDRVFSTEAKFVCNCGPKCDCDTISQKAGKCPCGKDMKAVKK